MQLRLLYSLKKAIEDRFLGTTIIARDGAKYPKTKPYFVIKQMNNLSDYLTKQRETVTVHHHLQLSYYAETYEDMVIMQDAIRDYFMFEEVALLNVDLSETGKSMLFSITNEIPMLSGELEKTSNDHRVHFDIKVVSTHHKNRGK